ncbi:MAG: class I SAM-dependent methyltransferase [Pseudomonadota bacterium]
MSVNYYNQNAKKFFNDTVSVNMESFYREFLKYIPKGGYILDVGCGSGRDSKAFLDKGYKISAFDVSEEMVKMANKLTGVRIDLRAFNEVDEKNIYDGIWACASLLHVPHNELSAIMLKLLNALKSGGAAYVSFKHGTQERVKDGRIFTDLNEQGMTSLAESLPSVTIKKLWLTDDRRPDRQEKWLNAILLKY